MRQVSLRHQLFRLIAAVVLPVALVGCGSTAPASPSGSPGPSAPQATPTIAAQPGTPAPIAASGIHKIQHVIVIMQENRSFDSYFGTYPGADGIPMANGVSTVWRARSDERPVHQAVPRPG
jgi:phospholipase C